MWPDNLHPQEPNQKSPSPQEPLPEYVDQSEQPVALSQDLPTAVAGEDGPQELPLELPTWMLASAELSPEMLGSDAFHLDPASEAVAGGWNAGLDAMASEPLFREPLSLPGAEFGALGLPEMLPPDSDASGLSSLPVEELAVPANLPEWLSGPAPVLPGAPLPEPDFSLPEIATPSVELPEVFLDEYPAVQLGLEELGLHEIGLEPAPTANVPEGAERLPEASEIPKTTFSLPELPLPDCTQPALALTGLPPAGLLLPEMPLESRAAASMTEDGDAPDNLTSAPNELSEAASWPGTSELPLAGDALPDVLQAEDELLPLPEGFAAPAWLADSNLPASFPTEGNLLQPAEELPEPEFPFDDLTLANFASLAEADRSTGTDELVLPALELPTETKEPSQLPEDWPTLEQPATGRAEGFDVAEASEEAVHAEEFGLPSLASQAIAHEESAHQTMESEAPSLADSIANLVTETGVSEAAEKQVLPAESALAPATVTDEAVAADPAVAEEADEFAYITLQENLQPITQVLSATLPLALPLTTGFGATAKAMPETTTPSPVVELRIEPSRPAHRPASAAMRMLPKPSFGNGGNQASLPPSLHATEPTSLPPLPPLPQPSASSGLDPEIQPQLGLDLGSLALSGELMPAAEPVELPQFEEIDLDPTNLPPAWLSGTSAEELFGNAAPALPAAISYGSELTNTTPADGGQTNVEDSSARIPGNGLDEPLAASAGQALLEDVQALDRSLQADAALLASSGTASALGFSGATTAAQLDVNLQRHVVFLLAGTRYAVPVTDVMEMATVPRITQLPNVPDFVRGITNLRGEVLAVIDLRQFLSLGANSDPYRERMLVVKSPDSEATAGFIVDSVRGLARVGVSKLATPALTQEERVTQFLDGVCEYEGQVLHVLHAGKLFRSPEMAELSAP